MTLKAKVNGGAPQTGHVVVAAGDTVQLTADGMGSWDGSDPARWEIYDYLDGWSLPAGWTDDGDGIYYFLGNQEPPTFQPAGGSHYVTNLSWTQGGTRYRDESTGIDCPTSTGFTNIAAFEGSRFGNDRQTWAKPLKSILTGINSSTLQGIKALGSVTGAQAFDGAAGNIISMTATGNITLTLTNLVVGKDYSIDFTQDATGGRTLTLAGFTPLIAGSFDVDPAASATTVLTFRVIRAGKVMLSQPPVTGVLTNQVRAKSSTDLSIVGGDYESLGAGCRANVKIDLGRVRTSGSVTGAVVVSHSQLGILQDLQAFGTRAGTDSIAYLRYGFTFGVRYQIGTADGIFESATGGDWIFDLLDATSKFMVRSNSTESIAVLNGAIDLDLGDPGAGVDSKLLRYHARGAVKQKQYWHGGLTAFLDWYTDVTYIMAGSSCHLSDSNAVKKFSWSATGISFFAAAVVAKQTVTGAKGGNAALTSLMTALSTYGLVTDSTT